MNKLKLLLGALLILVISLTLFRFSTSEDDWICGEYGWERHGNPKSTVPVTACISGNAITPSESPKSTVPTAVKVSDSLTEYKNTRWGFTMTYPKDLMVETADDGKIAITKWGPTQKENTEFFDGISIVIDQGQIGTNKNLLDLINSDIEQEKEQLVPDYKMIEQPSPFITWYKTGGLTYRFQDSFGQTTKYYLPLNTDKFLILMVRVMDPTNLGFESAATKIVESIKIL